MFEAKLAAEFINHHEFQSTYLDKISVFRPLYFVEIILHWHNNKFKKRMNVFWIEFPGYFWLA